MEIGCLSNGSTNDIAVGKLIYGKPIRTNDQSACRLMVNDFNFWLTTHGTLYIATTTQLKSKLLKRWFFKTERHTYTHYKFQQSAFNTFIIVRPFEIYVCLQRKGVFSGARSHTIFYNNHLRASSCVEHHKTIIGSSRQQDSEQIIPIITFTFMM